MMSFLIGFGIFALAGLSLFLILIVLMQRVSSGGGLGSALGGGASETALGAQADSILNRWTVYGTVLFFVLTLALYLLTLSSSQEKLKGSTGGLPTLETLEAQTQDAGIYIPGSLTEKAETPAVE